jgi:hypothetical protein
VSRLEILRTRGRGEEEEGAGRNLKLIAALEMIANEEEAEGSVKPKRLGGRKRKYDPPEQRIYRDPADGTIKPLGPRETEWYRMYVENPQVDNKKFLSQRADLVKPLSSQ